MDTAESMPMGCKAFSNWMSTQDVPFKFAQFIHTSFLIAS